jgi:hypothetical protein
MKKHIIIGIVLTLFTLIVTHLMVTKTTINPARNLEGLINPSERLKWELKRLCDPVTGKIPYGIRAKELAYAQTLPNDYYKSNSLFNWTNRGPWNVGGRTRAFALDIQNENTILAGGVSGGMWRSTDGGLNWTKTTKSDQLHNVTCLKQDLRAGKQNVWYFGTGEVYGNSASESFSAFFTGDGLFKSEDNGLTWEQVLSTASGTPQLSNNYDLIWNIALDQSKDTSDIIYIAAKGKLYISTDGAESWSTILNGGSLSSYFTDVAVTPTGVAYATLSSDGLKKGIWRSIDGINWVKIIPSNFPPSYYRTVIAINPQNENELYFLAVTPGYGQPGVNFLGETEWHSLWKYTYIGGDGAGDNGNWVNLSENIPNNGATTFDNFYAQGSYNLTISIKPDDPNVIIIGGTNVYRSTDGFTSQNNIMQIGGYKISTTLPDFKIYPNHHPDIHVISFLPSNPNVMFTATDGGVFRTDNCLQDTVVWTSLNNGYLTTQVYAIGIDENNINDKILAGFQDNGNFYLNSADPKASWVMPLNGDGSFMAMSNDGNTHYLSIQNGRIYKMAISDDGTPTAFSRIDPIGGTDYQFINPFVLDYNNNDIMYVAAGKYIWRNDSLSHLPYAGNFDSISKGWFKMGADANYSGAEITALAISKKPANRLYYGTSYKKVYRVDSANTGDPVHVCINNSYTFPNAYVSCIAIDPENADKVMIVYSNYNVYSLYYSEDGGTNWAKVAGNLEQFPSGTGVGPSCRWASIFHYSDSTYYLLATSAGMYYTTRLVPDSTVWTQTGNQTIGNVVCEMIKTREADGFIALGTHGAGVFSTKINLNSVKKNNKNELIVSLFPNPAKDFIKVRSEQSAICKLKVLGVDGKTYYSQEYNPSERSIEKSVSTKELNNGVYITIIETTAGKSIHKFIIQK